MSIYDSTKLHPLLQVLANELVKRCKEAGLKVKIADCVRNQQEQDGIDASRTNAKYPNSFHNWGLAFDVCQDDTKNSYPEDNSFWNRVGGIGKSLGLEWGGDWTNPLDRPHFQMNTFGTCAALVKKYGTPEKFFAHKDFNIKMPKGKITPKSDTNDIIWMQVMLNKSGYCLVIDGAYGNKTRIAVANYLEPEMKKLQAGTLVRLANVKKLSK